MLRLAAGQGGVISINQSMDLGFTSRMRDYRLSSGAWTAIGRLGYRIVPMSDPLSRLKAAVALLPGGVVSHRAAAHILDFSGFAELKPVVTVHTRTTHDFPGVEVRRGHDLRSAHVAVVCGLPTTVAERTLIDLARDLSTHRLVELSQDLIIARRLDVARLEVMVGEVCRRGKPGSAAMREALQLLAAEPAGQSVLERKGRALLSFGMLPEPVHEYPIPWSNRRRFDDAYPDSRLAIEWDSRSWHGRLERIDEDRRRDRECVLHGWRLLRFTWLDVTRNQNDVLHAVRVALRSE